MRSKIGSFIFTLEGLFSSGVLDSKPIRNAKIFYNDASPSLFIALLPAPIIYDNLNNRTTL